MNCKSAGRRGHGDRVQGPPAQPQPRGGLEDDPGRPVSSSDEVHRFQNEAEAVARLDHPNIVPIFEVGRFEDQHYFSMKLIAGESLDKRLKDYTASPRPPARLMAVVAEAIHHAHQRGILHRDLKPANILVDADGHPHVTDFGLAKRVEGDSELTRSARWLAHRPIWLPSRRRPRRGP